MPIDLNDTLTRSVNLTNASGAAVDADTLPTYVITLPDGTTGTSPTVQHGVTGEYYVAYPTIMAGLHNEKWTAVIGGQTVVIRRMFIVEEPSDAGFVDTDEALAHMRATGIITGTVNLEYLRYLCMVASAAVEGDLGRKITRRTVTTTVDGSGAALVLNQSPVISVTSIVENGTTLVPGTDYTVNQAAGIIYRGTQQYTRRWCSGVQNVVITYLAGYQVPPLVARKVALNTVTKMWQSSQQMPHPYLDSQFDLQAAVTVATGQLTGPEYQAYTNLRQTVIA